MWSLSNRSLDWFNERRIRQLIWKFFHWFITERLKVVGRKVDWMLVRLMYEGGLKGSWTLFKDLREIIMLPSLEYYSSVLFVVFKSWYIFIFYFNEFQFPFEKGYWEKQTEWTGFNLIFVQKWNFYLFLKLNVKMY